MGQQLHVDGGMVQEYPVDTGVPQRSTAEQDRRRLACRMLEMLLVAQAQHADGGFGEARVARCRGDDSATPAFKGRPTGKSVV